MKALYIYLAGPMSADTQEGIDANLLKHQAAFDALSDLGHYVFSPGLSSGHLLMPRRTQSAAEVTDEYDKWLRIDFAWLDKCDAIFLLDGWEDSHGARREWKYAQEHGKQVILSLNEVAAVDDAEEETIFEEANRLVNGPRQKDYGHPRDDFAKQALMMTGVLYDLLREGVIIPAPRVPLLMECVKISRATTSHKRDHATDGCGYWGTWWMVVE